MGTEIKSQPTFHINFSEKRKIAFDQLKQVIYILEKHLVVYWIEYGTLLGAVREKTAILWDGEFDIGVWSDEYEIKKMILLLEFTNNNFLINFSSKDRVKLIHKDSIAGAFQIDIHTYHVDKQTAYVSFNKKKYGFFQGKAQRIYQKIKLLDRRERTVYMMDHIIKQLLINVPEIPEVFSLVPGIFNSNTSFKIIIGEFEYDMDEHYLSNASSFTRLLLTIVSAFPKYLQYKLIDYVGKIASNGELTNDVQSIPIHFFQNLTKIQFEDQWVSCPLNSIDYVECVYGQDWYIRKPTWNRTLNKINKIRD